MVKVVKLGGWVCVAALAVLLVAVVVGAFGALPESILKNSISPRKLTGTDLVNAESNIRGSLLQAVAGVLLVIGAITAWRQMLISRMQQLLGRRVAVTEAFAKAVECLGNEDNISIRLGGIYSFDRIANDDPSEQSRIAEILSAYVRERTVANGNLQRDVLAALNVLTRRKWPIQVDLAGINLAYVRLPKACLDNVRLNGTDLSNAVLNGASLRDADLTDSDLRKADLTGADLSGATVTGSRMSGALSNSTTRWPNSFVPAEHGVLAR